MEGGQYKQTYKVSQDSVSGLEDVKALCTEELVNGTLARFEGMHGDFGNAFKKVSNK